MRERLQRFAPDTARRELWPHEVDRLTRECQRWRRAVTPADARACFVVDEDDERTRRWLTDVLGPRCAETSTVRLAWPAHGVGIETSWSDFVADHEKLWLPSSDDVWVVPLDLSWFLEMDHEERLSVWVEDDRARHREPSTPGHEIVRRAGNPSALAGIEPVSGAELRVDCQAELYPGTGPVVHLGSFCDPGTGADGTGALTESARLTCGMGFATAGFEATHLRCDAFDRTCQVACDESSDCRAAGLLGVRSSA